MKETPFQKTMSDLFWKLEEALRERDAAQMQITIQSAAIRGLAGTCENEEEKADYLGRLEEMSGKPGFKDAILSVIRGHTGGPTPTEIKSWILIGKKMSLSGYSNPMASIHTTLRRMNGNEVEEFVNDKGEKAYRLRLAKAKD